MDEGELRNLLAKKDYGIVSSFGKGSVKSSFRDSGKSPNVECSAGCEPFLQEKDTLNYSGQCTVIIKVYRKRLADVDGCAIKYHLDFLRRCGAIKDDTTAAIRLVFAGQEKVGKDEEERCEITVEYPEVDFDNLWVKTKVL